MYGAVFIKKLIYVYAHTLLISLHSLWFNETYMEIALVETFLRFHIPEGITYVKEGNETYTVTH